MKNFAFAIATLASLVSISSTVSGQHSNIQTNQPGIQFNQMVQKRNAKVGRYRSYYDLLGRIENHYRRTGERRAYQDQIRLSRKLNLMYQEIQNMDAQLNRMEYAFQTNHSRVTTGGNQVRRSTAQTTRGSGVAALLDHYSRVRVKTPGGGPPSIAASREEGLNTGR